MVKNYRRFARFLILIMFLSILKVSNWMEKNIQSYSLMVGEALFFRITRLNWQYGFFTSKNDNYQFLGSTIQLIGEGRGDTITVTDRLGGLNKLVKPINGIRINTAIQQMVRDSMYLEVGARSIALYLFNQYPQFRNIDFIVVGHNRQIVKKHSTFSLICSIDTLYNKRLSY